MDNTSASDKKQVNGLTKDIAETLGCVYVQHKENCIFQNGKVIEELFLVDGLHLMASGTEWLLKKT